MLCIVYRIEVTSAKTQSNNVFDFMFRIDGRSVVIINFGNEY